MTFNKIYWWIFFFFFLSILNKFNIPLWSILILIFLIIIIYYFYNKHDRDRNPEKWKRIDKERDELRAAHLKQKIVDDIIKKEKNKKDQAENFWREYQEATKKIPKSAWVSMNKYEKSAVYLRREQLKSKFEILPFETQSLIKSKYPIDTSFPYNK